MKSMTGFSSGKGAGAGANWVWDIRSVNSRGMDARLRVPDWIEGLEQALRSTIQKQVARGNINLSLKITREDSGQITRMDPEVLGRVLDNLKRIEDTALGEHNLQLAPTSAAEVLQMPGLSEPNAKTDDTMPLRQLIVADFQDLIAAFDGMRQVEGRALHAVLSKQLEQIEHLTDQANELAKARQQKTAETLRKNLALVLENSDGADPGRVAQELAMLAVKADVTEEIDRIRAHVSAATDMLEVSAPVGRKLDFLMQEFNREANTLCSKAQYKELTRIGLDLKAVIEQMREQVQNVE